MKITSLTLDGDEYIDVAPKATMRLNYATGFQIATATFRVFRPRVEIYDYDGPSAVDGAFTAINASYNPTTGLLTEDSTASVEHATRRIDTADLESGGVYLLVVEAKADTRTILAVAHEAHGYYKSWFNLSTGAIGSKHSTVDNHWITPIDNGYYRCIARITASSTADQLNIYMDTADGDPTTYNGDGSSGLYIRRVTIFKDDFITPLQFMAKKEIIFYSGATNKVWGGYVAKVKYSKEGKIPVAVVSCQSYAVKLKDTLVDSEEVYSGTDEAAIDDLFATYLSEFSTADVNTVESTVSLTIPARSSMRRALELLIAQTGAAAWIDAEKNVQYGDETSDPSEVPFALREDPTILYDGDGSSGATPDDSATWSGGLLTEDTDTSEHYLRFYSLTMTSGERYTASVEVKANGRTWIALSSNRIGSLKAWFDIGNGVVGNVSGTLDGAHICALGDDWYRLTFAFTATSSGSDSTIVVYLDTANDVPTSYAGDGVSGAYIRWMHIADGRGIEQPFEFERDNTQLCNDCTVKKLASGESGSMTVEIAADSDDAETAQVDGTSLPPGGSTSSDDNTILDIQSRWNGTTYIHSNGFWRFDTSNLPSNCTITSAKLRVYVTTGDHESIADLALDYYDGTNWPITTADHSNTEAAPTAGLLDYPSSWVKWLEFTLTSPDANINKSGYTGFRLRAKWDDGMAATFPNTSIFARIRVENSAAGNQQVQLVIDYTIGPFIGTATDTPSQNEYGVHDRVVIDNNLNSAAEADLIAAVIVARDKDPHENGSVVLTKVDGLAVGQLLPIEHPTFNIDAQYLIRKVSVGWKRGATVYKAEFGQFKPDVSRLMRSLDQAREEGGS
jgi:hypothetical protein